MNYAERDRLEGRLSPSDEQIVIDTTRELLTDTAPADGPAPAPPPTLSVLAYAVNGDADSLALRMLAQLLHDDLIDMEVTSNAMMSSDLIAAVRERGCGVLCLADLPPSPSSKSRYLTKKVRAALPELTIIVGRWAASPLEDDNPRLLSDAGATHVSTRLVEARDVLRKLIPMTATA